MAAASKRGMTTRWLPRSRATAATMNGPLWARGPGARTHPSLGNDHPLPIGATVPRGRGVGGDQLGPAGAPAAAHDLPHRRDARRERPRRQVLRDGCRATGRPPASAAGTPTARAGSARADDGERSSRREAVGDGLGHGPERPRREHALDEPDGVGQADRHRRPLFHADGRRTGGQAGAPVRRTRPGSRSGPTGEGGSVRIDLGQLVQGGKEILHAREAIR